MFNSNKNFEEDFHLENGNYYHICKKCQQEFIGYKRRIYCKECDLDESKWVNDIPEEEHILWRDTFKEVFYPNGKLDLVKLEAEIDELLALETKESLIEFLMEQRAR